MNSDNDYSKLLQYRDDLFPDFFPDQEKAAGEIAATIKEDVNKGAITTIIDLGCGTGEILASLSKRFASVTCIGVDICAKEIELALGHEANCRFVCGKGEDPSVLRALGDNSWNTTLLLCVGHTVPHFQSLDAFLAILCQFRPAFLFVDFYHGWDSAVEKMRNPKRHQNELQEPKSYANERVYFLTTKPSPGKKGYVCRGIEVLEDGKIDSKRFWTEQFLEGSDTIRDRIEKLDYVPESDVRYPAGYGSMRGFFFSSLSASARQVNDVYFKIVSDRIGELFSIDVIGKRAMDLFGTRVAAVIEPFDAHHTFARYVSIFQGASAPDDRMYVAKPANIQTRFPTAFGLFMTLLNNVSSGTVIQLSKLKDANKSPIDDVFGQQREDPFFTASAPKGQSSDTSLILKTCSEAAEKEGFFVVPFYFADLPLFCLVVDFSQRLPISSTDPSVYFSVLRNTAQLIKQELLSSFEIKILRPFIEQAVFKLTSLHDLSLQAAIERLRAMRSDACAKPWKSWLLALASEEIRALEIVKSERRELDKVWASAETWVLRDIFGRISDWFRSETFFSGEEKKDAHVKFIPTVHNKKLQELINRAGVTSPGQLATSSYFTNSADCNRELQWLAKSIECFWNKYKDDQQADANANQSFRNLKYVFCRNWGGDGSRFRFHLRRIACLCSMYYPNAKINDPKERTDGYGHDALPVTDDQTLAIANLFKSFRSDSFEAFSFDDKFVDQSSVGCKEAVCRFELNASLKTPFYPGGGEGDDQKDVFNAFGVCGFNRDTIPAFKAITLRFSISGPIHEGSFLSAVWDKQANAKYLDIEFTAP
jgi:SAM-dependent methyltransferase